MTLDGTFCRQGRQVDTFKRLTWQIAKQVGRLSFLAAFGINSTASPSSPAQIKSWDDFWENWGETNLPWLSCAGPSNIGVDRETEITDRRPQIKTGEGGSQRWRTGRKFKQIFLNLSRDLFTSRYSLILQAAGHPRFGSKAWPHKSPARKDQRLVPDELTPPNLDPCNGGFHQVVRQQLDKCCDYPGISSPPQLPRKFGIWRQNVREPKSLPQK